MAEQFISIGFSVNGKDGTRAFTDMTRVMVQGHKDLRGAFISVINKWLIYQKEGWLEGGIGHRWSPLKRATIEQKMRHYPENARKILVRTGDLRESLTVWKGRNQTMTINEREAIVASDIDYAIFHQLGTKKMARRPVVPGIEYSKNKDHEKAMADWHFGKVRKMIIQTGGTTR